MPGSIEHGSLPFGEQIEFFRGKLNLPTASWTDIFDGQHARAFVVAGAMKDDLLTDLRGAVDKVIADGATLEDFRKDFDALVQRHGWVYNGGRNWRTRVIYHTNLRQSYNSGRWQQQQQVIHTRPFWRYRHSPFQEHPRAEHQAWDGLVLRHDDAFWSTHYPQNAWGCDCDVETLSARDLKRLGKDGPDEAPAIEYEERTVGVRGPNPRTVRVPKGIDPGFGYSPGEAAYGKPLANEVMDGWRAQGAPAWDKLTPKTWMEFDRPPRIPLDPPRVGLQPPAVSREDLLRRVRETIGGPEKVYDVQGLPVAINAESLAEHIDDFGRAAYLPLLDDALADPFETWVSFERHKATGYVALRARVIKGFDLGQGRGLLLVANAVRGRLEGWTFIPTGNLAYLQRQRQGELIYGRPE